MQFSDDGATVDVDPVARARRLLRRLHRRRRRLGHRAARAASRRSRSSSPSPSPRGERCRRPTWCAPTTARSRRGSSGPSRRGPPTPSSGPRATHRSSRSRISWWTCSPGSPAAMTDVTDHVRRNRAFWDADADDYQAAHGDLLARHPKAWGVWRIPRTSSGRSATPAGSTSSSTAAARRSGRSRSPATAHARWGSTSRPAQLRHAAAANQTQGDRGRAGVRER